MFQLRRSWMLFYIITVKKNPRSSAGSASSTLKNFPSANDHQGFYMC
jgi:hypothetical protein